MDMKRGTTVASAVALMLAAGCTNDTGDDNEVDTNTQSLKCQGINDCKGMSECAGAESDCMGMNECAGMGWITVDSEEECTDGGGTLIT